jgi:hypothetical protein
VRCFRWATSRGAWPPSPVYDPTEPNRQNPQRRCGGFSANIIPTWCNYVTRFFWAHDKDSNLSLSQCVTMRWFRSNGHWGTSLALFALAIQFCLAFAHVHLDPTTSKNLAPRLFALLAADQGSDLGATNAPSAPEPNGIAVDNCVICTVLQMAGTAAAAPPPETPLPPPVGHTRHGISRALLLEGAPYQLFQARAPPTA